MGSAAITITPDAPVTPPVTITPDAPPASAASRLGKNFASGAGYMSDDDAKNFFEHPLDTVIKSFEAQGRLAAQAREAYKRGDYEGALQHALNYLVPFVGQQTDQAGEQIKEGDVAGGVGRTLGAALPIVAGSPEARAAVGSAGRTAVATTADTTASVVRAAVKTANKSLQEMPGAVGASVGGAAGSATGLPHAGATGAVIGWLVGEKVLPKITIPGEGFGLPNRVTGGPGPGTVPEYQFQDEGAPFPEHPGIYPGAPLPQHPGTFPGAPEPTATPEQINPALVSPSRTMPGQVGPEVIRPRTPTAQPIPPRSGLALPSGPDEPVSISEAARSINTDAPRTLSGESALRQILAGQDTANLFKIAKSRGLNVSQESMLREGLAGPKLINKIIDSFSDDELDNVRSTAIENTRMGKHDFGDINGGLKQQGFNDSEAGRLAAEFWKTKGLQTYFPDVKIPAAVAARAARTQASAIHGLTESDISPAEWEAAHAIESGVENTPRANQ